MTEEAQEDERQFFYRMRKAVKEAFEQSPIRRKQGEELPWSWDICDLPFRRGGDLLLGLNWGYKKGKKHLPAPEPPGADQVNQVRKYPFISRTLRLLDKHGFDIATMNYFNVCPFRSPGIAYLEAGD